MLAEGYAAEERYGEAADTLLAIEAPPDYPDYRRLVEGAAKLPCTAPAKAVAPLPDLQNSQLSSVYFYVGAVDRLLELSERDIDQRYISNFGDLWRPNHSSMRKMERFKALMRNAGLVDYWRARGWPDLCRPMGADDFVCD